MKPLWLLGLGIALLCIPCATFDGLDHCSFEQILGEWNILAIATNCEWIAEQFITAIMKVNITKLEDGSFNVTTNFCMEDVCLDIEMTYTKQENGMYICKSDVGDKIVERMKTDCKNYITMGTRDLNPFINDKIVALYGRYREHFLPSF
ncbi:lipocalin-like [Candoia aspera]|uniref:lipocalin-like n=1 Tax=Candoia aspera TaxID=51853 RepID=UPI002FD81B18